MSSVVVYDACVLYPSTLRDLLIRIAQAGLVQAKWSNHILDEMLRTLEKNRSDIPTEKLERTRILLMNAAVRDSLITGYESLIESISLPDPDDRHVVAAAIRAQAQMIVTANLKHFPTDLLSEWGIEAKGPDEFLVDQIDLDRQAVYGAIQRIADSWQSPPGTVNDVLNSLERSGIVASAAVLRKIT